MNNLTQLLIHSHSIPEYAKRSTKPNPMGGMSEDQKICNPTRYIHTTKNADARSVSGGCRSSC